MSVNDQPKHEQNHWMGAFYAILAAVFTAFLGLVVKLIGGRASTDTMLFVRYLLSFCFVLPWAFKDLKGTVVIQKPVQILIRSGFTLLAVGGFFYALKYIPLTNAILLNNSYPLFVPLIVQITHKITTSRKMWMGIALGFVGLVLVLKPDLQGFHLPSIVGLLSGVAAAGATVMIRELTKWASISQILFYNFLIGLIVTGILLPFFGSVEHWVSLIPLFTGLGIFAVGYQYFSTLAFAKAPTQLVAPMIFLSVIFGVPLDYIFWGRIPDWVTCVGIAAVIAGGMITIHFGHKHLKKNNQ